MPKPGRVLVGIFATAAIAVMTVSPIAAQEAAKGGGAAKAGAEATKVLFDDGRVRVQEVTFKPGSQGPSVPRPFRVIRVMEGGTMQRTWPDGRSETVEYKAGEVRVFEADKPFVPKNIGNSDIVLYVVAVREMAK